MRIPVWLTLGVAILVILFGVHRIRLSFRSQELEERARQRKGLYSMGRRTHLLIGIVYLLLGGALVGASYGWNPFGDFFGPSTAPAKDPGGTKLIPLEQRKPPAAAPDPARAEPAKDPADPAKDPAKAEPDPAPAAAAPAAPAPAPAAP